MLAQLCAHRVSPWAKLSCMPMSLLKMDRPSLFCSASLCLCICKASYVQAHPCCQLLQLIKLAPTAALPLPLQAIDNLIPVPAREAAETALPPRKWHCRVYPERNQGVGGGRCA